MSPDVENKFLRPDRLNSALERSRIYSRLNDWPDVRAILVHAPAGFGKTSFVSMWLDSLEPEMVRSSWLSLDESDRDPTRFVTDFARALDSLREGVSHPAELLLSYMTPEQVLAWLMADLELSIRGGVVDQRLILVLDNYDLASCAKVDMLLSAALDANLTDLTLVIISRLAEVAPLDPLYVVGEVVEVGLDELRLDRRELQQFLTDTGLPPLDDKRLDYILERTQGWFAALQLIKISLPNVGNIDNLIAEMHGNNRRVFAYLFSEVIRHQSDDERQFLLRTAILDRFNPKLAAVVSDNPDAYRLVDELMAKNVFLMRLDEHKEWYRYHPLFQEALQHELRRSLPDTEVVTLHRRAADWLSANGMTGEAIAHFTAASAYEIAAELLWNQVQSSILRGETHEAQRLLDTMPPALRSFPQLCLQQVVLDTLRDRPERFDRINHARLMVKASSIKDEEKAALELILLAHEAAALYQHGDVSAASELMDRIKPYSEQLDAFTRQLCEFLMMHLVWREGRAEDALRHGQRAMDLALRAGFAIGAIAVNREIALKAKLAGQGERAAHMYEQILSQALPTTPFTMRELLWTYIRAADNAYWMGLRPRAYEFIRTAHALAKQLGHDPAADYTNCLSLLYEPDQEPYHSAESAEKFDLNCLQRDWVQVTVQNSYFMRILIKQGRLTEALALAADNGVYPPGLTLANSGALAIEGLYATIAARRDLEQAGQALSTLLEKFRPLPTHTFYVLRLLVLTAWLDLRMGRLSTAAAHLDAALSLSEKSGYIQTILDLPELHDLLRESSHPFARRLLNRWPSELLELPVEQLTSREKLVLTLLASDLEYLQIAEEMQVSLNTVRTHVRHIYRKLNVNRREQAIATAKRLGLFA